MENVMKKLFFSFCLISLISSVLAHNIPSQVVSKIQDRAKTANLKWIDTQIRESVRKDVNTAIQGSAGMLKYLAFYMPKGALHNKPLFCNVYIDPTPFIQSIAVLAFVHALDNEDTYNLYEDEDSSSPSESEEAAIEVLKECCPKFSKEIGLI